MSISRTISKIVRRHIARFVAEVYTNEIAQVVEYNAADNLVTVRPVVTRFRSSDATKLGGLSLPVMADVSVKHPGSGKVLMTVAPEAGSYGSLHFSDRCIEQWVHDGGVGPPRSARKFDLNDCWFEPGLYHQKDEEDAGKLTVPVATDRISLRTRNGVAEVSVLTNGTININTAGGSITISTLGDITMNGGSASVAREGDDTLADSTTDTVFLHAATGWVNLVSVALNAITPGAIAVIPTSITGKVNDGSSAVKVP